MPSSRRGKGFSPGQLVFKFEDLDQPPEREDERAREWYEELWYVRLPVYLKENECADLTFLQIEGKQWDLHSRRIECKDGGVHWRNEACQGPECWFCKFGLKSKRAFLYSVIDHRRLTYVSKWGEEVTEHHSIRYLRVSTRDNQRLKETLINAGRARIMRPVVKVHKYPGQPYPYFEFSLQKSNPMLHAVPPFTQPLDFHQVFGMENRMKSRRRRQESASD